MRQTAATKSATPIPLAFSLSMVVLVLGACDNADPLAPDAELDRLEVLPASAELSTVAPGNTVTLTILDGVETGARESSADEVITFVSSSPTTAEVDSRGVVTALTPGTARIIVTLSRNGVTRAATTTVSVRERGAWAEVGGVYDLTAVITGSDPAWGIEDGTIQVAVITIQHDGGSQFMGTFSDFYAIAPSGEVFGTGSPGSVSGVLHPDGRIVMELTSAGSQSSYWHGEGIVTPQRIAGEFGAGGHISGTFTANRRNRLAPHVRFAESP